MTEEKRWGVTEIETIIEPLQKIADKISSGQPLTEAEEAFVEKHCEPKKEA